MRASLLVLFILAAAGALAAQTVGPALVVREGDVGSLRLARVEVEARILGSLSETKMTLTFANPSGRELEGDLYFPLPEGAAVCGYALDIEGKMIDGVVVDKEHGAQAYEAIVRRRTDPALLEHVHGNTFRARVFPIPRKGTRTISLRYVVDLAEKDRGLIYQLPLNFKEKVDEFRLRIEAAQVAGEPRIIKGGIAGLAFQQRGTAFVAEAAAKDVALTEPLVVALPRAGEQDVIVEKAADGKTYFYLRHGLPAEVAAAAPAAPKRITVLWDGSGSRANADLGRQKRLLASCLARLGKNPVAVDLVVFRNVASPPQRFMVQDGRAEELLKAVAEVAYDGGTQMASLSPPPGAEPPDFYLLFTDGLSTFGKEMPESLGAPVFIFVEGVAADRLLLGYLALRLGGALLDLDRMSDDEILPRIGRPVCRFLGAEVASGRAADLCPLRPRFLFGRTALVGRIEGDEARITLRYSRAEPERHEVTVTVSAKGAPAGNLLSFVWARNKIADLMAAAEPNEKEIARLGKQFGVVTPLTSLIVLESLQQHLQYHIRPPDMLPEMQKQYDEQVKTWGADWDRAADQPPVPQAELKRERINDLLVPWYYRIGLWEEEHTYPPDFRYKPGENEVVFPGGVGARLSVIYDNAAQYFNSPGQFGAGGSGLFSSFAASAGGGAPRFEVANVLQAAIQTAGPGGIVGGENPVTDLPDILAPEQPFSNPFPSAMVLPPARHRRIDLASPDPNAPPDPWEKGFRLFDPETPCLRSLASATPEEVWRAYMGLRKTNSTSPAFYTDCADFFLRRGERERGMQVLSNLSEFSLVQPMRTMAFRLQQLGMLDLAAAALEEAIAMEPHDASSLRDLAVVLAQQGKYDRAVELLYELLTAEWPQGRVVENITALVDLNRLLPKADPAVVRRLGIDRRLIRMLDADLRVVVASNTSGEVSLTVTEPSGEKCWVVHGATTIGGQLWLASVESPTEYTLRRAMPGRYKIEVKLDFLLGPWADTPVIVRVDIFTDFGRPTEKQETVFLQFSDEGETATVKEMDLPRAPGIEVPGAKR